MDRIESYSIGLSGFEVNLLSDIIFHLFSFFSNEIDRVSGNYLVCVFSLNLKWDPV